MQEKELKQAKRLKQEILERAHKLGFDDVRITDADFGPLPGERLGTYIKEGRHASMSWMPETQERRAHPQNLWPEVRSVIMLAMNYGPDSNPLELLEKRSQAAISVYAQNRDYHDIIKGRLKEVASIVASKTKCDVKVFVDTAPVMEKPLAAAAGLGWQGKHTNVVSRRLGSWFFLGAIFTSAELLRDEAEPDHCGNCRKCLDICPTKAFPAPYQLDANRCISYLTIEHHGPIDPSLRKAMGNRIYGCDDCLAICPWNKFAKQANEAKLIARDELKAPRLAELLKLDDTQFRQLFSGSPIKRIGRNKFIRNVLIAAGNSEDQNLLPHVQSLLTDADETIVDAAQWALAELTQHN